MIKTARLLVFACLLMVSFNHAHAINTVLSGNFDGSESKLTQLPGTCDKDETLLLGYLEVGTFRVSDSGEYAVMDAYTVIGVDISALIYQGSFDPNSPTKNLVTPGGIDIVDDVDLNAGTDYVLVIQHWCDNPARTWVNRQGAWTVSFSGPGEVTSDFSVQGPEWTEGMLADSDPTVDTDCGETKYKQAGPIRVSKSGEYFYSDVSIGYDVDMCLQIFSAPFDPANPTANRLTWAGGRGFEDDDGSIVLEADTDYWFVTQSMIVPETGEFFYLFAASTFYITYAMSGSWYDPATTGQGFLIDVFDNLNNMFLAWFTFDLERPPGDATAQIGDPGHRWMTAAGPISGTTGNLDITWSSGMIFDSPAPPVSNEQDGTMTVEFDDCKTGRVIYDLGSSGRMGTVEIQRIVNDAVELCETLTEGPTNPGPL